jgi:hypothetical protein
MVNAGTRPVIRLLWLSSDWIIVYDYGHKTLKYFGDHKIQAFHYSSFEAG